MLALTNFCVAPVSFPWQLGKVFEKAATEDDVGTKTATNGALSSRILCKLLARSGVASRVTFGIFLRESRLKSHP